MSEDRLDSALEGMKQETVDPATLEGVRARVWNKLTHTAVDGCADSGALIVSSQRRFVRSIEPRT